jgi:hypothetical protein
VGQNLGERYYREIFLVECRARIFVMGAGERAGGAPRTVRMK